MSSIRKLKAVTRSATRHFTRENVIAAGSMVLGGALIYASVKSQTKLLNEELVSRGMPLVKANGTQNNISSIDFIKGLNPLDRTSANSTYVRKFMTNTVKWAPVVALAMGMVNSGIDQAFKNCR